MTFFDKAYGADQLKGAACVVALAALLVASFVPTVAAGDGDGGALRISEPGGPV